MLQQKLTITTEVEESSTEWIIDFTVSSNVESLDVVMSEGAAPEMRSPMRPNLPPIAIPTVQLLPPPLTWRTQGLGMPSPSTSGGNRSRYHSGCHQRSSEYLDWASTRGANVGSQLRARSRSTQRSQHVASSARKVSRMDVNAIETFLNERPDFLEAYVVEHVDLEIMERWMIRKVRREKTQNLRKGSLSKWKFCVHADKRKMLQDIMESLKNHSTKEQVLWELANCIGSAVGVDGFEVYLLNPANQSHIHRLTNEEKAGKVEMVTLQAAERAAVMEAARLGQALHLQKSHDKHRFPAGFICSNPEAEYVLCQPITQPDGETTTVLEMWRLTEKFNEEDEEIIASYMVWGGIALHYAQLYLSMDLQRNLADFLLTVVRSIFQDMISMDTLVAKVMNFAQKLVDADRASLFLVDAKSKELYASVFDIGVDEDTNSGSGSENSNSKSKDNKEIRLPLGTGIAGHVAETGEILNIQDAYKDQRFNHSVDALTGYKTKTILCMPIYIRNVVIGVMQMVNKRNGVFTKDDEKAFEMFAVYCGLALHHAKLYDKIKKSEQKYKVALEVLSYHNTCSEEEIKNAMVGLTMPTPCEIALDDFYFSPFIIDDNKKASNAIYMFANLFGLQQFDQMALIKFVLTVKKNYRRVPYHNWTHGFSVANTMYNILKKTKIFSRNEQVALFIAALCHDLDHRGKNNKFMLDTASPLAAIYSTSTLEHHHFNQTVTILQQDGHNIFSMMSNSDYKNILSLVKQCILATDLAMFFPNKTKLGMLIRDKKFEWKKFEHRLLLLAIAMTASDLAASAKPWDIQVETVKVIFEEFYEQGDEERAAGREPLPMMDRNRPEEQAASQVGFLSGICLPCYTLLHELIPQTRPLLEMCQRNLALWQQIDQDIKKEMTTKTRKGDTSKRVSDHLFINIDDKKK